MLEPETCNMYYIPHCCLQREEALKKSEQMLEEDALRSVCSHYFPSYCLRQMWHSSPRHSPDTFQVWCQPAWCRLAVSVSVPRLHYQK